LYVMYSVIISPRPLRAASLETETLHVYYTVVA
jgi:hypothetical protein